MTLRKRLSTKQREDLYRAEVAKSRAAGFGDFPICALCGQAIFPGSKWHVNHEAHKPHWLGGQIDGVSHQRCNAINAAHYAGPLFAKSERIRKKHLDLIRARMPLPGGRDDQIKKTVRGEVVDRRTGQRWGGWK